MLTFLQIGIINAIARKQWEWVERMDWHNDKRPLEYVGLIASEVGEAANECRMAEPTKEFGEELADIILRTLDAAVAHNVDIGNEIARKMKINEERGTRGRVK